jgi:hypothetical protein
MYLSGNPSMVPSSGQPACPSGCPAGWQHKVWDWVEISIEHRKENCSWQGQLWRKKSFRLIRKCNPIKTCRALVLLSKQLACCARDLSHMAPGGALRGGAHNRLAWNDPSRTSIIYASSSIDYGRSRWIASGQPVVTPSAQPATWCHLVCQLQVFVVCFLLISTQSHTLRSNHVQLQTDRQGWCEEGNLRLPDGYIKDLILCLNFSWPCMYVISPSYTHNNETKKMVKVYKTMVRFIWWP